MTRTSTSATASAFNRDVFERLSASTRIMAGVVVSCLGGNGDEFRGDPNLTGKPGDNERSRT
jgi:hypothetical protein